MLRNVLKGTGVAIVTPFQEDYSVDYTGLEKLINYIIDGGINYIVSLGTTGETPVLSEKEKEEIISFTLEVVNNRVPVVVGVGGNNTASLVNKLNQYPLDKAVAVLSASPYYNKPSQQGIIKHYEEVAKASPAPVILYNVPARTGRNMAAETTLYLANHVKNIAGIKEASGDMGQCMHILRDRPNEFLVVSGDDALAFPQLACGMDGVISVAANVYPKTFSTMVNLALHSDNSGAKQKNDSLIEAYRLMFLENNPAGAKAFLNEMKIIKNVLRLPNIPVDAKLRVAIEQFVQHEKMG
ncbi:MAG: 4-hydroxy-tetrahydrodipicolinate synthase [Ferruginibacter sp.]|nr:4-hydroxy-tetrahydrodipicolinate synthase [Ferruginibacter sp.]